jgi:hypothetical protein
VERTNYLATSNASSDRASHSTPVNNASTSVSVRLEREFSTNESSHADIVGTGTTEITMEFENDTIEKLLNFTNDLVDDIGFLDQLDFDGESIDTNLLDDDDYDMGFEQSSL